VRRCDKDLESLGHNVGRCITIQQSQQYHKSTKISHKVTTLLTLTKFIDVHPDSLFYSILSWFNIHQFFGCSIAGVRDF